MSTTTASTNHGLPAYAVRRLCGVFAQWPAIERVLLYGSRAKGTYRKASDIDLCVEAPSLGLAELLEIDHQIDDLLLPWKVDLSLRHHVDEPRLQAHIERVGRPIYDRSEPSAAG